MSIFSDFIKTLKILNIKYKADMKIKDTLFSKKFESGGVVSDKKETDLNKTYGMQVPVEPFKSSIDMDQYFKRWQEEFFNVGVENAFKPRTRYGVDYMKVDVK